MLHVIDIVYAALPSRCFIFAEPNLSHICLAGEFLVNWVYVFGELALKITVKA